jgi:hypothetical protein
MRDIQSQISRTSLLFFLGLGGFLMQPAAASDTRAGEFESEVEFLPEGGLFNTLLADVKEPQFFVSGHRFETDGQLGDFNAGSVAYGEKFGLARWRLAPDRTLQLGIAGGVFAQFNMSASSKDLINADYTIGLRVSYRDGLWSHRVRLFHQSTHLGDEFLLDEGQNIERVNFSIEAMDYTISREWANWRGYGGLGRLIGVEPESLERDYALLGGEYQTKAVSFMRGRWLAGLHLQASEQNDWSVDKSLKIGLGFGGQMPYSRRIKVMLEAYDGNMPFGQFYNVKLQSVGLGIYFGF